VIHCSSIFCSPAGEQKIEEQKLVARRPLFVQPLEMCRMFYGKRLLLQRHISQPGRTGPEKNEKVHHARPFSALFGGCDPQDLSTRRLEVEVVVAEEFHPW
jgi:hypothetical protein